MFTAQELNDLAWLLRRLVVHGDHAERLIELEQRVQEELAKQKPRKHAA